MREYFIRRFLLIPPTLLGVTLLVITITRFVPGGPVERALQEAQKATEGGGSTSGQLGGGMSEEQATLALDAINRLAGKKPWQLSFSYGRALQASVLKAWQGKDENIPAAQAALMVRAKANSEAQLGKYGGDGANGAGNGAGAGADGDGGGRAVFQLSLKHI